MGKSHSPIENNTKSMKVTSKTYKIPQVRLSYVSDVTVEKQKVSDPASSSEIFRKTYADGEIDYQESFKVAYLNRAMKILGIHTISTGGTSSTVVDSKIIFSGALLANASSIILCHNHPSGNLKPSPQDDSLTKKLVAAGNVLDIKVIDHIILSTDGYFSYADEGRL